MVETTATHSGLGGVFFFYPGYLCQWIHLLYHVHQIERIPPWRLWKYQLLQLFFLLAKSTEDINIVYTVTNKDAKLNR